MGVFDLSVQELELYRPQVVEPDDFDEFWMKTLADNPFVANSVVRSRLDYPLCTVDIWDVEFGGFAGDPIHAWYILPAGVTQPLPTVVQFQGYGGSRGLPVENLAWASAGFAHFMVDTRGQGGTWGSGGVSADPHGSGSADQGFMTRGIEDPEDYYYRRVFVDAHHAIDAVRTFQETDSEAVIVHGISQGGGIALAATALNPHVRAVLPDVPFLCHFERGADIASASPYEEIVRYLSVFRDRRNEVFATLSYFDGVNMAKRGRVPALFSTAMMDTTCPPSTVYAAKNWWADSADTSVDADIDVYYYNNHEGGAWHHWRRQIDWLTSLGIRSGAGNSDE